jgi:glycosyltransferase involved in cell wall biosynthesis
MSRPRITVHIPSHNYAHYLPEAIDSLLAQTYQDWEAIVIDDASTDSTPHVLSRIRDPRINARRHERCMKNIRTYNEAIELARGEFFVILSADDRYRPEFLQRVIDSFDRYPQAALVYTNYEFIGEEGQVVGNTRSMPHDADGLFDDLERILEQGYIAGCAAVTRTGTLKRLGMYDVELPYTADTFLWRRIALEGPFAYVHEPLYQYRLHGESMSHTVSRTDVLETEHVNQLARILSDPSAPAEIRSQSHHFRAQLAWITAETHIKAGRRLRGLKHLARSLYLEPLIWRRQGLAPRLGRFFRGQLFKTTNSRRMKSQASE